MTGDVLMTTEPVETGGEIAIVTISNPDRLNAMHLGMWRRLADHFDAASANDSIRCVILKGDGGRAFASGADIASFETERADVEQAKVYGSKTDSAMHALKNCRHPVIAAIEGVCVGGGLEIALLCDLRICGRSSRFGIPSNRLGLTIGFDEIATLVGLCGPSVAMEVLFEAQIFGAEEALQKRLVNAVVEDELVMEDAMRRARRIASGAPLVNRWHKKFLRRLDRPEPPTEDEIAETYDSFGTADFREGYRAFLEKRTPLFRGE